MDIKPNGGPMGFSGMNNDFGPPNTAFPLPPRPNYHARPMTQQDLYVGQKAEEVSNVIFKI